MARWLAILLVPSVLFAQSPDDLTPLFEAYAKERAAAKANTAEADRLAARAEASRKAENFSAAARFIRDARWALPSVPSNLPAGATAFGANRLRHGDRANCVRYIRDGKLLLTTSNDRTVRVWDVGTGRELLAYRGPADTDAGVDLPIRAAEAVFLPDGERIASVSGSGRQIHVWEIKTGKTLQTLSPKLPDAPKDKKPTPVLIKSIAVTKDGKHLASGSDDKIVRLWDLETGKETFASAPHANRIEAVAAQPNGKLIAAVDADGYLSVYDPTGENKSPLMRVQVTDGGTVSAYAVRFTPGGAKIVTGGGDKQPRILQAPNADNSVPANVAASAQKLPPHESDVLAVAVAPDGRSFVSAGRDKKVRVVDELGEIVRIFDAGSTVLSVDVRPDGRQIAAACDDGKVHVWDFQALDEHRTMNEAKEPLWGAAVNADGTLFATAGADKIIRVYSPNGQLLHSLEGSTAAVTSLVFLPENKLLSAGGEKLLRLWDAKAGKPLGTWSGNDSVVLALAATPDGKTIISGSADKNVRGWADGKVAWTWVARGVVTSLAVSSDGKTVLVGGADGSLNALAITDGKASLRGFANAHISGVSAIVFSPDGASFATAGGDGQPKLWSLPATGNPVNLLWFKPALKPAPSTPVALSGIAFSPDGKFVAAAGADKIVRIYDVKTGNEARSLRGSSDWITALAYVDGDRLLAVCADRAARVFDVTRFDPLTSAGHTAAVRCVAISRDGKMIASAGEDKTLRLWDRATGADLGSIACPIDFVYTLVFAGDFLVCGGKGGSLIVFNVPTKQAVASVSIGEVYGLAASADGAKLGVFSRAKNVDTFALYSLADMSKPLQQIPEKGRKITAASFTGDLGQVAVADEIGRVYVWKFGETPKWMKTWYLAEKAIADIGFAPKGDKLLSVDATGVVTISDALTRTKLATADPRGEGKANYGVNALVVSPAGDRFALVSEGPEIKLFDFAGKELKTYTLPGTVNGAAFSADGKTLATANADGSICVIDLP